MLSFASGSATFFADTALTRPLDNQMIRIKQEDV
jgi:hypothetical protein